jgi:hypothetical protein
MKGHEGTISGLEIAKELRQACKEMYRNPWAQSEGRQEEERRALESATRGVLGNPFQ